MAWRRGDGECIVTPRKKTGYMISSVSESYQIHPQTLRLYERLGLLTPSRSEGNTRLYTAEDLQRLEVILTLTRELGVNLAGVEVILNMREKMERLQKQVEEMIDFVHDQISPSLSGSFRNALVRVPAAKIMRTSR
jgi:MerR family transcriptional regulator/heat shock protein HspR